MSTNGKRKRRTFSEEFKRDAVNLVVVEGYTIAAAARAVNVLDGSLREWYRKYAPQYPTPRAINGEAGIKIPQQTTTTTKKCLVPILNRWPSIIWQRALDPNWAGPEFTTRTRNGLIASFELSCRSRGPISKLRRCLQ